MKKTSIISFFFFITTISFSQNLALFDDQGIVPNGESINVFGMVNDSTIISYISVINQSASVISVKVIRHPINIVPGTINYYCWGQCYTADTDTSEQTIHIAANDTSYDFSGEYQPQMRAGTSVIRYLFYNINNASDTISFTAHYVVEPLEINSPVNNKFEISNAYPNPAYDNTTIKYTLPKNSGNARLIIRDCIGAIVKDQPLTINSVKITINLSDLMEGIYFYSVIADGSALCTRKLVVK